MIPSLPLALPHPSTLYSYSMYLALPWEVIEQVVEQLWDRRDTLHNFSLVCRQLHPLSSALFWAHIDVKSRDHCLQLCETIRGAPHIGTLVRSITVSALHLTPSLLYVFPNLSNVTVISPFVADRYSAVASSEYIPYSNIGGAHTKSVDQRPTLQLHPSSLTCYQQLGTHISTLHLVNSPFLSSLGFAQVLLAFKRIKHLSLDKVLILQPVALHGPHDVLSRRLSAELQLNSLTVGTSQHSHNRDPVIYPHGQMDVGDDVLVLLHIFEWTCHTVQHLSLTVTTYGTEQRLMILLLFMLLIDTLSGFLELAKDPTKWKHLCSITVKLGFDVEGIQKTTQFFNAFRPPNLKGAHAHFHDISGDLVGYEGTFGVTDYFYPSLSSMDNMAPEHSNRAYKTMDWKDDEERVSACSALEQALLSFTEQSLLFSFKPLPHPRKHLWMRTLGEYFPVLRDRNAITFDFVARE